MKISKIFVTVTGLALAAVIALAPMTADASRFRGTSADVTAPVITMDGLGDGTGICDGTGDCDGTVGEDFIDEDGDGICDTFEDRVRPLDGSGSGRNR